MQYLTYSKKHIILCTEITLYVLFFLIIFLYSIANNNFYSSVCVTLSSHIIINCMCCCDIYCMYCCDIYYCKYFCSLSICRYCCTLLHIIAVYSCIFYCRYMRATYCTHISKLLFQL